jgi:DNA-binding transcriptional LysR family regulator
MIETRLLRYFVTVAETEHIGKASKVLHVSQSPLSRQIRQLEDATGLLLFERERQRIRITSDGKWLLERARRVLAELQGLERDAGRRARGEAGTLRVGFVKTAMTSGLLPRGLKRFREQHADVDVELQSARSAEQLEALLRGALDVALIHEATSDARLACRLLREEPLSLVVPATHPLAKRKAIVPADLHGCPWIALRAAPREANANDALLAACHRLGFAPRVAFAAHDQETVLGLVAAGMGVAFLPESFGATRAADVTVRRLPWLEAHRRLYVLTRVADVSRITTEMLACLQASTCTPHGAR